MNNKFRRLFTDYHVFVIIIYFISLSSCSKAQNTESEKNNQEYSETHIQYSKTVKTVAEIPTPEGYKRIEVEAGSYPDFLRNQELKTENNLVYLFDGTLKHNQDAQFAVLKIDVGKRDLQQCADAVMRLRAEYLYGNKQFTEIHFNFLSDGKPRYFKEYAKGDFSYKRFRSYMDYIFSYANTGSLHDELKPVENKKDIKIGDVFIQKRKPYGHAITVMDIAQNTGGELVFLLSQSYMPAQEIHILKNPSDNSISPWFTTDTEELQTPEWLFYWTDLKRF